MSASNGTVVLSRHDGTPYVLLAAGCFNVDKVRRAFEEREDRKRALMRMARRALRQSQPETVDPMSDVPEVAFPEIPYRYVREAWTDFLIVESGQDIVKIPYTVSESGDVDFGAEVKVEQTYQEVGSASVAATAPSLDTFYLSRLDDTDHDLLVELGSSASLDRSPKKNWVENAGGLPPYVREVARSIEKTGKTLEQAIQIAIGRIKVWAVTGKGDTKAKAAKALAQWEALKAKSGSKKVAASNTSQVEHELPMPTDEQVAAFLREAEVVLSAWGVSEDTDLDVIELHGQKTDPGYEYLHSPNPKVAAAANRIFAAARRRGLNVKQAQAAIPSPPAWKSAHERDGGNRKLISGDKARAAERRGNDLASQTIGGNKTGSTRPWQTGAVANRASKPAETRRKKKGTKIPNPKKVVARLALSNDSVEEVEEYVTFSVPTHVNEVLVGGVYETKAGGLAQMLPVDHGYEVSIYPKGSIIQDGEVATDAGAPVEVMPVSSELLGRALLKRLANQ